MLDKDIIEKLLNKIENQQNEIKKIASKNTNYVYHIKSKDFKGDKIYSLNKMKDINNEIYKKSLKKYKNRIDELKCYIDMLDCTWADCVNLSTVNPIKILTLLHLIGADGWEDDIGKEVYQIPIKNLKNSDCCIFDDNISENKKEAYSKFSEIKYKESKFIPHEAVTYFAECVKDKESPLIFGFVNHVLVKDEVSLVGAKILKFDPKF